MNYISKKEYETETAATRDQRMAWFREARFGLFIHYGLYSELGTGEWSQANENYTVAEYEKIAVMELYVGVAVSALGCEIEKSPLGVFCLQFFKAVVIGNIDEVPIIQPRAL